MEMQSGAWSESQSGSGADHERIENLVGVDGIEAGVGVNDLTVQLSDVLPLGVDHHAARHAVSGKVDCLVDFRKFRASVRRECSLDKHEDRILGPYLHIVEVLSGKTVDVQAENPAPATDGDVTDAYNPVMPVVDLEAAGRSRLTGKYGTHIEGVH